MKDSVIRRRERMVKLYSDGYSPSEIVSYIVSVFGISERQAWRDWGSRRKWMPSLIKESDDDVQMSVFNLLYQYRMIQKEIFRIMLTAESDFDKLKAANSLLKAIKQENEIRYNIGQLPWRRVQPVFHSSNDDIQIELDEGNSKG